MRRPAAQLLGIVGGVALAAAAAASMTPRPQVMTRPTAAAAVDTLTGCLQKGTKAGEYKLVEASGQSVNVKSSSVKLSGHVGHEVKVTTSGMAMASDTMPQTVSKMSMVSTKCSM
jgi:FlaG/FlaF family flagellin (archaellin)